MNKMYQLGGKTIRSMLGICSGTVAAKASVIERLANMIPGLAFITTKSINLLGKEGNKAPIFASHGPYSGINAVGLDNIGAKPFAADLTRIKLPKDFFLMVSLFGATVEDVVETGRILYPYANGFEFNGSCSHSAGFGRAVGEDLDLLERIIVGLVALGKPVYLKLSARMDVVAIVLRTRNLGIAGYTITNTLGPEPFEIDGHPVLTNKVGSISGREITERALNCIKLVRQNTTLEIIGTGGISTGIDVRNALNAGANVCAIGTGFTGMSTVQMAEYIPLLLEDIESEGHFVERFLAQVTGPAFDAMEFNKFEVAENKMLANDLFYLRFDQEIEAGPGQFVFVWVPGKGERPFSVLTANPLSLLVGVKGACTEFMSQLKPGDSVYVRGPHGNVPKVFGKILLVGGGTGVAALHPFAQVYGRNTVAVLGAKDGNHLFDAPFRSHCAHVFAYIEDGSYTDDGSRRRRGVVTMCLRDIVIAERPDFVLNCGPLGMIKAVIAIEDKSLSMDRILSSVEFHTDCGVGICGKDATPTGWRPCVDGTFLTKMQLGI